MKYVIIIVLLIDMIINSFKKVNEQEAYIIERFWKFNRVEYKGKIVVIPFIESVKCVVKLDNRQFDLNFLIAILTDNKVIKNKATVDFHIIDPQKAAYECEWLENQLEYVGTSVFRDCVRKIHIVSSTIIKLQNNRRV